MEPRFELGAMGALECPVFEVFFGGARGGGKTDGMLGEFMVACQPVRRSMPPA